MVCNDSALWVFVGLVGKVLIQIYIAVVAAAAIEVVEVQADVSLEGMVESRVSLDELAES